MYTVSPLSGGHEGSWTVEVWRGARNRPLLPNSGCAVSISLFSDRTSTPKLLGRWGDADAAGIKAGVDALRTVGCTNFQARARTPMGRHWPLQRCTALGKVCGCQAATTGHIGCLSLRPRLNRNN